MSNEVIDQQEVATAPEAAEVQAPEVTCDKCQTTKPWGSSSWCPDCGYYPGVTDIHGEEQREYVPEEGEVAEQQPLMPMWLIWAIAGPTTILVAMFCARYYFTFYGGDRSLFSFVVLLTGIVAFAGAHILTSFKSMQADSNCSPFDMVGRPIEMWRPTIHGLPDTGFRIVSAVSGVTAIISALVITGGIDFGSIFLEPWVTPDKKAEKKGIVERIMEKAPAKDEDPDKSIEEIAEEFTAQPQELDPDMQALLPSPDDPLTCVVYGYMKDGKDDFGRLLLAANVGGTRVHVGTLSASEVPKHVRENLITRLSKLHAGKPAVESRYLGGTWVEPRIGLNIKFDKWTVAGELSNARLTFGSKDSDADSDADGDK